MYWEDSDKKEGVATPDDVVDLVYRIELNLLDKLCPPLPKMIYENFSQPFGNGYPG